VCSSDLAADALALEAPGPDTFPSPLADVDDADWTCYVRRAQVARPDSISPSYRLGAFALTARELTDAGFMSSASKGEYQGRHGVWLGEWAEGRSLEKFLGAPAQQYEAFVELTRKQAQHIIEHFPAALGTEYMGLCATLSGLLAVARKGGRSGLRQWLTSEENRATFPESGALYARFNGLF
jgi:hypothetical protein